MSSSKTVDEHQYAQLCDVVERAWQNWPTERSAKEADCLHTSAYARQAAVKILDILGLKITGPRRRPTRRTPC